VATRRWRRWLSEMVMLLHDHAANAAREARGRVPVTGIWISEGGRPQHRRNRTGRCSDTGRGGRARPARAPEAPPARRRQASGIAAADFAIIVVERMNSASVAQLQSNWLGPAVAALEHGELESLSLLADGHGIAAAWHASRPGWRMRMSAKYASRSFMPPQREEDDA
jgi:hypothetical protein